jgi:hypothetical protein
VLYNGAKPQSCHSYTLYVGSESLRTGVLLFLSLCFTLCSQDLASSVIATGKATDFCKVLPSKAVHWLEENYPSVANKLQRFLDKYGHRCIKEVSSKLLHIWFDPSKWNETQNIANSQMCRLWCSYGIHSVTLLIFLLNSCEIIFIIFKHPVAFIYTLYTLKYTVFNATLSFSFFVYSTTCFGCIGPSSGVSLPKLFHCKLYIKCWCSFRCAYFYHLLYAFDLYCSFIAQVHFLTFKTLKIYMTFIKFIKTLLLLIRSYAIILGCHPLIQSM